VASDTVKIIRKVASFPGSFFQTVCGSSFDLIFQFRN
jgi:hypothetical protein